MTPHVHISALNVLVYGFSALLVIMLLNLTAMKLKDNSKLWASYANIMGVD